MGNVEPKGVSRFDDDAEFAASFVLGRREVEEALAAASEPLNDTAESGAEPAASRNRKLLYAAAAAIVVFLAAAVLWLGV